eukprot:Hpha_TRINITY_DN4771_c0_g1::TRINITY_DN4771_c0_g1_i1::g.130518::m.130518
MVDLVEWGTFAQQPCDRVFKRFKSVLRRRWMAWFVSRAKEVSGKVPRPTYPLWQEWIEIAIKDLEIPDDDGITPVSKSFSQCGLGPDPKPNHDLKKLLEFELSEEDKDK